MRELEITKNGPCGEFLKLGKLVGRISRNFLQIWLRGWKFQELFSTLLEVRIWAEVKHWTIKNVYLKNQKLIGIIYIDITSRNYMLNFFDFFLSYFTVSSFSKPTSDKQLLKNKSWNINIQSLNYVQLRRHWDHLLYNFS